MKLCTCSSRTALVDLPLVDVEHQLLASLIVAPKLLDEVPGLEVDDFERYPHKAIFEAMRNLEHRGEAITVDALHEYMVQLDVVRGTVCRLHAGQVYVTALLRTDNTRAVVRDAAHVRAWAGLLRRMRHERERAQRNLDDAYEPRSTR